MKFPAYPKYKPSGVEWLGDVPEKWTPIRLKWIATRYAGGSPDRSNDAYWEDGSIPWINSGEVNQRLITEPSAFITPEGYANSSARWVPAGALVLALAGQGKTKGMVAQTAIRTTCNQSMAAIVPNDLGTARYYYWLLVSQYESIRNMAGGEQRDGLNLDILGEIPCFRFDRAEQKAIGDFLDAQTARVDALLAKRRALIEKLSEKRAALISRTVTRGLNPNIKLKPSGIEWLGDIAHNWDTSRIKFLVSTPVTDGPHSTPEIFDEGIPFVSAEAINNLKINFDKIRGHITPEDHKEYSKKYKPKRGDIYMVKSGATTGRVAMVETDMEFNIWSPLAAIRCNSKLVDRNFLFLYMQSREFQTAVELSWSYGTQQNIGMGVIQNLEVPLPPLAEQIAIAEFLDRETAKIDRMVEKVEAAIGKLQEYRTALITAAVTGKIDVRKAAA